MDKNVLVDWLFIFDGNCSEDRTLYSKKYGVDLIRFTHNPASVICASKNKWDGSYSIVVGIF